MILMMISKIARIIIKLTKQSSRVLKQVKMTMNLMMMIKKIQKKSSKSPNQNQQLLKQIRMTNPMMMRMTIKMRRTSPTAMMIRTKMSSLQSKRAVRLKRKSLKLRSDLI